ncbi:type II secretion system F family protein [Litorivivens sp.]|uniref:type II secretion system F family protein n=1 Tax=Litorivivens sp. TaxID=2020868 RepID=UPI00356AD4E4
MEAYHVVLIACVLMLGAVPILLLAAKADTKPKLAPPAPHKQTVSPAAAEDDSKQNRRKRALQGLQLEPWRQLRKQYKTIDEIARLFRQCGIGSAADQMRYLITAVIVATVIALLCWVAFASNAHGVVMSGVYALLVAGSLLLFMKRLLKERADKRQKRLEEESLMLIQTTRMLWRVGLSLPKTLSILCDELRHLTPDTASELKIAVKRIDSGQAQDDALQELCNNTTAEGFREYLIILRQESTSGGGIDSSLNELYEVLQNRRKTGLQEKVSKTSGNMSVIMMLFMFPSLIIVIGGPGFIAISRALSQLNGD